MLNGGLETDVLKILSDDDIKKIHNASMKVLEEVGVNIGDEEVLTLCEQNGARVDYEAQKVYFNEEIVMGAVETAPSTVILYGRDDDEKI